MADIELSGLFQQKQREFKLEGAGLTRFTNDFIDAVNRSTKRINREANLETPISTIADTDDTVTGLDDKYEDVLSHLVSLNLLNIGQRPAKGGELEIPKMESEASDLISGIYFDLLNDQMAADADDESTDIIGLGHLG